jgi:drug/metabolite transporter (DMT)-like permease
MNLRGAAFAVTASALLAGSVVLVRLLTTDLPVFEVVFFRNLFGLLITLPLVFRPGRTGLKTANHRLFFARGSLAFIAMVAGYSALAYLPLNEATALSFTAPLFGTLAAIIVLKEDVQRARWIGTMLAFAGALIVLRPGLHALHWPEAAMLVAAAITGINGTLIKQLTRTEPSTLIVTYMTLYGLPLSGIAALAVWVDPPVGTWLPLIGLGLCSTLGNICLTRAFAAWDASAVVAFDFARLPITAVLAWMIFVEIPDPFAWIGGLIIVAGLFYASRHEVRQRSVLAEAGEPL